MRRAPFFSEVRRFITSIPTARRSLLVAQLLAPGKDVSGNVRDLPPLDVEPSLVAEQWPPDAIAYVHHDAEASRRVVVPFADVGDPAEQHREAKADYPLIESLVAGTEPQAACLVNRQIDVDRQMLVRTEVVDDAAAGGAVDHVSVEPPRAARLERANPGNSFAPESIDERIVFNRERDVASRLRKHDAPPGAQPEEWLGEEPALPDLVHHAVADRGDAVRAREAETALNLGVETPKVAAQHPLVDRTHVCSWLECRRQRAADGMLPMTRRSIPARDETAMFNETGLNAAAR